MQAKAQLQAHASVGSSDIPRAHVWRGARSFGSTCCPARPPSPPLGQGGSCQARHADWEISNSPAKSNNSAVLSSSYHFSLLPILLRGAQTKRASGLVGITLTEVSYMTSLTAPLKIQVTHLIISVLGQQLL